MLIDWVRSGRTGKLLKQRRRRRRGRRLVKNEFIFSKIREYLFLFGKLMALETPV